MKQFKLFFACALMSLLSLGQVWADTPAAAGTTLFSEDFSSYKANDVPSGSVTTATVYGGGSVTYTCTDGGSTTKIYNEATGGGTAPEILVSRTNGTFVIAGIPSGSAQEITVSFTQNNQALSVEPTGTGYSGSVSGKPGAVGTRTFDITVADGADATFTLTFKGTSSSNVRVDDILVTVKTAGEGAGSPKTLSSIAVSGAPDKTSYYAGDEFDPAGLTVTGTYSDASTAPINSGITWGYNPSQTLVLNQTSIGVTATVSEITSAEYNVTGLTVAAAPTVVSAIEDIEDGASYYIRGVRASGAVVEYLKFTDGTAGATISGTSASSTAEAIAITFNKVSDGVYQLVTPEGLYVQPGASNGKIALSTTETTCNLANTTKTWDSSDAIAISTVDGSSNTWIIQKNTSGTNFGGYKNTQYDVTLVLASAAATVAKPTISGDENFVTSTTVTLACSTTGADIYYTTDGSDPKSGTIGTSFSLTETATVRAIAKLGSDWSAEATKTFTKIEALTTMDAIFTKANAVGSTATDVNITFGSWVVSGVSTNGKNVFVTDGTKGFVVFDNGGSMGFAVGDVLSGTAACKVQLYKGAAELTLLTSTTEGLSVATGGSVTPEVKAISALSGINTGAPVTINSVQFDGEYLSDGANSIKPYNSLFAYEPLENGKYYNVTGIYQQFGNTTKEILPRSAADIEELTLADPELSYSPASETIEVGDSWSAPTFNNEHGLTVSFSGDNDAVATVNTTTGEIALAGGTGTAVITASFAGNATYAAGNATYTITVNAADSRKSAVGPAEFTTTSGFLTPSDILYISHKGGASTAPGNYNSGIRLYQISGTNTYGGYVTLIAKKGCKIDEVEITTTSKYATTVGYYVDAAEAAIQGSADVAKSGTYNTATGLNADSVRILNLGTGSNGRLEIASITVYYTGDAAAVDHYELGGSYQTEFEIDDAFNHDGLSVYMAYDAGGTEKLDLTAGCTFSEPDMTAAGTPTVEISFGTTVITSYDITVAASTLLDPELSYSPASVNLTVGDALSAPTFNNPHTLSPITYNTDNDAVATVDEYGAIALAGGTGTAVITASYAGDATYNAGNATFTITVSAYDPRKLATGSAFTDISGDLTPNDITYAAYKGDGTANPVVRSGDDPVTIRIYKPATGKTTGGYLTVTAIAGCTIDQVQITFSGSATAAYSINDAELPTDAYITGEAVLLTPTALNAQSVSIVNLKNGSIDIAEINVWYNGEGLPDPELSYSPASDEITLGDAWSDPTFNNPHSVTITSYASDNEAVATVTDGGVIALAGGTGTANITASFDGNASYKAGSATYTIIVNAPAPVLTGTTYTKVTSTGDITDGEYLIVYETENVAFNGDLATLDAAHNTVDVVISGSEIAGTADIDAAVFTLDVANGTIQAHNGNYIGVTTYGNGLKQNAEVTTYPAHTFEIDGEGNAIISIYGDTWNSGGEGYMILNYNDGASDKRFRYYKAGSQKKIQLYKKEVVTPTPDYTRTEMLGAGVLGTICVDHNVTSAEGATFYEVSGLNGSQLVLAEVTGELEAGVPYVFQATGNVLNLYYGATSVAEPVNSGALKGTFSATTIENTDPNWANIYYFANHALYSCSDLTSLTLPANRAYLVMSQVGGFSPMPGRRYFTVNVNGKTTPTGMEEITNDQSQMTNKVIIDGRLYILRGEKLYDATGRLVK